MSTEDTIEALVAKNTEEGKFCEILLRILSDRAFQNDEYAISLLKEAQKIMKSESSAKD